MKVFRSTLVAAVAIFAAACGDKVEIVQPTSDTTQKINSVTVSPANVTMNVGQTVTFTAVVDGTNGAATTVTWTPASGAVSVTSAGVATANSATPGVAVCATSTVDANKKGCAQAVVTAPPATVPASVSIQSITANGTNNVTVNPLNTAGIIDVRLNINPGTQTLSRVDLKLCPVATPNCATVVATQSFTGAQSAALRYVADEAMANQTSFPSIVFSVNTANVPSAATGAPQFINGQYILSAQLFTGTSTQVAGATTQTNLTLNNVDTWIGTVATSGTTANGLNAVGFRYDRGALTVSVVPVSYTGQTVASGTVTFGSLACDSYATNPPAFAAANDYAAITAFGGGPRTVALVAPVAPSAAWTATFAQTGTPAAGNVSGYEFNGCAGANAIGETPTVTAVNTNGDALFAAAAAVNSAVAFANVAPLVALRLDNRAPVDPAGATFAATPVIRINVNPNGRANAWLNDAVTFNGTATTTATSNNWLCVAAAVNTCLATDLLPVDGGITTGTTYYVKAGLTKAAATTAAALTNPTSLNAGTAGSVANTTWCGIAYAADGLGNETASPSTATACGAGPSSALFGVDRAAPVIGYCASAAAPCAATSLAANARLSGGTVGGEFTVFVNDTGLVGNSGMLPTIAPPAGPVRMLLSRRAAGATPNSAGTTTTFNGTGTVAAAAQTSAGVAPAVASPNYATSFTAVTGAANHAYWTHTATAFDAAGNTTALGPRVIVYDATAPAPNAPTTALTLTATGYTANTSISEDLDIQDWAVSVNYGAAPVIAPAQIQQAYTAVNGYNAAIFANTSFPVTTTVNLPLAIQANVGAGLTNMVNLSTIARSQSNLANAIAPGNTFTPTTITPGAAISLQGGAFTGFTAATAPAGVVGVSSGLTTAANAANPASTTLTVTTTGTTAIFNNPFSRVDFYMLNSTGTAYLFVGSTTAATLNDNGVTRTFSYAVTISGATVFPLLGGVQGGGNLASQVVALGMNANGNVGMVNAALLAFAVRD